MSITNQIKRKRKSTPVLSTLSLTLEHLKRSVSLKHNKKDNEDLSWSQETSTALLYPSYNNQKKKYTQPAETWWTSSPPLKTI
ncbi:hypothetical protein CU098_008508, partial [Rhizopus stolonifer]